MIFNIECCGGGQWRFLWCIIMRLTKIVKDFWWGVRLKMIYFLVNCGNLMRKKSSGISVIETGKPEIGLAPISPDMAFLFLQEIKYSIPTYPSSIISSMIIQIYLLVVAYTYSLSGGQLDSGSSFQTVSSNHLSMRVRTSLRYLPYLCRPTAHLGNTIL